MMSKDIFMPSNVFGHNWFYDKWIDAAISKNVFKNCTFTTKLDDKADALSFLTLGIDWAKPNTESKSCETELSMIAKQCDCGAMAVDTLNPCHAGWCSSTTP